MTKTASKLTLSIGDILPAVIQKLKTGGNPSKEVIEAQWKTLVGERGFKHSRPASLRKAVLTIKIDSPVWLSEFEFEKRKLLKGLKRAFGKDRISEIRLKIGEF